MFYIEDIIEDQSGPITNQQGSFSTPVKERRTKPPKQQDQKRTDKPKQDYSKQRESKRSYE